MLITRRRFLGWIRALGAAGIVAQPLRGLLRSAGAAAASIVPQRTVEFHRDSNAYVIRDTQSIVRAVLHTQEPVAINAATARDAAESYLTTHSQLLGVHPLELQNLSLKPQNDPTEVGVEYRLLSEKTQFDVTTITFQQTVGGVPTSHAGIAVHLKKLPDRFEVICVHTARDGTLTPAQLLPLQQTLGNKDPLLFGPPDVQVLTQRLGIERDARFEVELLRISYQRRMIYRYEAGKLATADTTGQIDPDAIPLPPVHADIVDGSHYVVWAVYFDLKRKSGPSTHWLALVEVRTYSVLFLDELTSDANGKVLPADPVTTHGQQIPDQFCNDTLNPLRMSTVLPNLTGPQELIGRNVKIVDIDGPERTPPKAKVDVGFEFNVCTDDFAAVSAYYNCDRFFTFVESLGFKRDDYFPWTEFPVAVDHRGAPKMGVTSNDAQTRGNSRPGPNGTEINMGIQSVVFALAQPDTLPPLGNAIDWRLVLHELGGHGTLLNHVASTRFLFAHSAGDSLAAILNDPESHAQNKTETFPWLRYGRLHKRDGWFWDGPEDLDDRRPGRTRLHQEQILSTTHFHLYKAIGGGNTVQVDTRHFAAKYAAYLILRAIQTLTPVTNPQHASDWLCNLIVADAGEWTSEGHSGGAYEKVIYWAFEMQGLFGGGLSGGKPPPVDVYIDDGRQGGYEYQADYASSPAIWNRRVSDGNEGHQTPAPDVVNFAYVKIKNRGHDAATSVVVDAFQCNSDDRIYPDDWRPMKTPRLSAPDLPAQSQETIVGPFEWIPSAGDNCLLMSVSADGDKSNLHKFSVGKPIADWRLVPNDNNLAMRKV